MQHTMQHTMKCNRYIRPEIYKKFKVNLNWHIVQATHQHSKTGTLLR